MMQPNYTNRAFYRNGQSWDNDSGELAVRLWV